MGALILLEVWTFWTRGWIRGYWIDPAFHFTYYGFSWVRPWTGSGMYVHFVVMGLAALGVMLGAFYRVSATILWLTFTYQFLLDQARYLNHFYAASLFLFLLVFIPADACWSIDAWRRKMFQHSALAVPLWSVWLLRTQVGIIYFYAGVAKINSDWLDGVPWRTWLEGRSAMPFVRGLIDSGLSTYVFGYGALVFDLLIVPALLWHRTRPLAFIAAVAFHFINAQLFPIGIFPWMMVLATTIFFAPAWPMEWTVNDDPVGRDKQPSVINRSSRLLKNA